MAIHKSQKSIRNRHTCRKSIMEYTFSLSSLKGGITNTQAVKIELRNSCRWSTKLIDDLNNNSSRPVKEYTPCIHKKRFERPSKNVNQTVTQEGTYP